MRLTPSYMLTTPPAPKITMATIIVQKYSSRPYPSGCFWSGGFALRRFPHGRPAGLAAQEATAVATRWRIAALPSAATTGGGRRQLLAHMAGGPRSAGGGITVLDPGLVVRVTETGAGTVTGGLPT